MSNAFNIQRYLNFKPCAYQENSNKNGSMPICENLSRKINDKLVLKIPPDQFTSWLQKEDKNIDWVPRRSDESKSTTDGPFASFQAVLPDFSGFKQHPDLDQFNESIIHVSIENAEESVFEIGAAGYYPPNVIKGLDFDSRKLIDVFGLNCYLDDVKDFVRYQCYGKLADDKDDILILGFSKDKKPTGLNNQIHVGLATKAHGGVTIRWYTGIEQLPKWRSIQKTLDEKLEAWNVNR